MHTGITKTMARLSGPTGAILLALASLIVFHPDNVSAQAYGQPAPTGAQPAQAAAQPAQPPQTAAQPAQPAQMVAQGSSQVMLDVDVPDTSATITNGQGFFIGGWAVASGGQGTGVVSVDVYLDSPQATGPAIGTARLGIALAAGNDLAHVLE